MPNGMLIAAAVHMGFEYKTYVDDFGYDLPNMNFNMSKRSIDELDFEIRPKNPATAVKDRRNGRRIHAVMTRSPASKTEAVSYAESRGRSW